MRETRSIFNFKVDHMTLLVDPRMYKAAYAIFRVVFGVPKDGIIYEKRRRWPGSDREASMTFAVQIGEGAKGQMPDIGKTVIAVVQPSEPASSPSHVRRMLEEHNAAAHWQHIALSVDDLPAFHGHAAARGVNFITPIMHDEREDLLQVFSGEWCLPGAKPSGLFFEFVQRNPTPETLKRISQGDRQAWFRDRTFLGLYEEKEREYQSGAVTPFIDFDLLRVISALLEARDVWQITEEDIARVETTMRKYAASRKPSQAAAAEA